MSAPLESPMLTILPIYEPMIYMVPYVMLLMRPNLLRGQVVASGGGASYLVLNSLFCLQMAASGGASIDTVHKWQQEEVLALWFLILYSVHRWQQVVALASILYTNGSKRRC